MYIYVGKSPTGDQFKVTGEDRREVLNMYEKKIIEAKDLDYDWEFVDVKIFLKNPKNYTFERGNSYGLVVENAGITFVWPNKIPHFARENNRRAGPSLKTILLLGLKGSEWDGSGPKPPDDMDLCPPDDMDYPPDDMDYPPDDMDPDVEAPARELDADTGDYEYFQEERPGR